MATTLTPSRPRAPRVFPLADLEVLLSGTEEVKAEVLGINVRQLQRKREAGLTSYEADDYATRAGFHPGNVWSTWFDAGSEKVNIARAIHEREAAAAKQRQRTHGGTAPGRPKNTPEKVGEVSRPAESKVAAAKAVGLSRPTYEKVEKVVDAAEAGSPKPTRREPVTTHAHSPTTVGIPEAAAALGISRWLAYELVKRNEFPVPVLRMGRVLKVSRRQLEDYVGSSVGGSAEQEARAAAPPSGDANEGPTRSGVLSLTEAAEMLGISARTAYDLARDKGELVPGVPVFKVASIWKVSRVQLEARAGSSTEHRRGDLVTRVGRLEVENAHLRQILGGIGRLLAGFDTDRTPAGRC